MESIQLSEYIIRKSKRELNINELQYYIYYLECEYYRLTHNHLIDENFEAWNAGPVISKLVYHFKNYGASSIMLDYKSIDYDILFNNVKIFKPIIDDLINALDIISLEDLRSMVLKSNAYKSVYVKDERNIINKNEMEVNSYTDDKCIIIEILKDFLDTFSICEAKFNTEKVKNYKFILNEIEYEIIISYKNNLFYCDILDKTLIKTQSLNRMIVFILNIDKYIIKH